MQYLTLLAAADLEQQIATLAVRTVLIASIILVVFTIIAAVVKDRMPVLKLPLFMVLAGTLIIATSILFGSTIYLNVKSESKGPVHWHTDIEYWACGTELELRNPTGFLSNKIGTATYHEHNDKRIHLEGVVVRKSEDASIKKFMQVVGGYITPSAMAFPLNEDESTWFASGDKTDGDPQDAERFDDVREFAVRGDNGPYMEFKNGQQCNGEVAELQTFVYRFNKADSTYRQQKLADPTAYLMRDEPVVPPGDCVIVEFDVPKDRTDKLCEQYGVRDSVRCTEFGVEAYNADLCNIRELVPLPEETLEPSNGTSVIQPSDDSDTDPTNQGDTE